MWLLPLLLAGATSTSRSKDRAGRMAEMRQRLGMASKTLVDLPGTLGRMRYIEAQYGPVTAALLRHLLRRDHVDPDSMDYHPVNRVLAWAAAEVQRRSKRCPPPPTDGSDWPDLTSIADWAVATETDITKMTLEEVIRRSNQWHGIRKGEGDAWEEWRIRVQREIRAHRTMLPAAVEMTWPDGSRLVNLTTQEQLNQEGEVMGHCVGRATEYGEGVRAGKHWILSLRDPDGWPVLTLQVRRDHQQRDLVQVKAPRDTAAPAEFAPYLRAIVQRLDEEALAEWQAKVNALRAKGALIEGDVEVLRTFPDGYQHVLLLTPEKIVQVGAILGAEKLSYLSDTRGSPYFRDAFVKGEDRYEAILEPDGFPRAVLFLERPSWGPADAYHLSNLYGIGGRPPDFFARPYLVDRIAELAPFPANLPRPDGTASSGSHYQSTTNVPDADTVLPWFTRGSKAFEEHILRWPRRALGYAQHIDMGSVSDTRTAVLSEAGWDAYREYAARTEAAVTYNLGAPLEERIATNVRNEQAEMAYHWTRDVDRAPSEEALTFLRRKDSTFISYLSHFPEVFQSLSIREEVFRRGEVIETILGTKKHVSESRRSGRYIHESSGVEVLLKLPFWREALYRRKLLQTPEGAFAIAKQFDKAPREDTLRAVLPSSERSLDYWRLFREGFAVPDPRLHEAIAREQSTWLTAWGDMGYVAAPVKASKGNTPAAFARDAQAKQRRDYFRIRPLLQDAWMKLPRGEQARAQAADTSFRLWLENDWHQDDDSRGEKKHSPVEGVRWYRQVVPAVYAYLLETPWYAKGNLLEASKEEPVTSSVGTLPEALVMGLVGIPSRDLGAALQLPTLSEAASDPLSVARWAGAEWMQGTKGAASGSEAWTWWTSLSPMAQSQVARRMKNDVEIVRKNRAWLDEQHPERAEQFQKRSGWRPSVPLGQPPPWTGAPRTPGELAQRVSFLWVGLTPPDALDHYRTNVGIVLQPKKMPLYGLFPWRTKDKRTGYILVLPAHVRHVPLERTWGTVRQPSRLVRSEEQETE